MNVRDLIELHEGRVAHAYRDSLGFLTIGVGHLIDERKGGALPDAIIDALLDYDIRTHGNELFAQLPWVRDLDPVRQAVMLDMYFNLRHGLLGFTKMLAYSKAHDWHSAADEMIDSTWARQVGMRAFRLAQMMRTGEWPA